MSPPVCVRDAQVTDWPFIRKAWRATFFQVGQVVQGAHKSHYFEEMTRLFSAIMPTASARVACDPSDKDTNLGFVVFEDQTLHYAYVEKDFRGEGIVSAMLEGVPIKRYSFRTIMGDRRMKPSARGWVYTPRFTFSA